MRTSILSKMTQTYSLIALDIDGTLRGDTLEPSDFVLETLDKCCQRGALIVAATGRSRLSAYQYLDHFPMVDYVVSFQGAMVSSRKRDELVWESPMEQKEVALAVEFLADHPVERVVYVDDFILVDSLTPWASSYGERNSVRVVETESFLAHEGTTYRVLAVGSSDEIIKVERSVKTLYSQELYATRSLHHFCEILSPKAGKEKALNWLCQQMDINPNEVLAFGNGLNDLEMIRWAGRGVAIEGGEPEALAITCEIAPPVERDGVAIYLSELLRQNLIGG